MSGSLFQILGKFFRNNDVRPVLVGGYAVISYHIQRMTFDVDFIMTRENCCSLEKNILALGYVVFCRN